MSDARTASSCNRTPRRGSRADALHSADASHRAQQVAVNQCLPAWVLKCSSTRAILLSTVASGRAKKTLGAPKSPSYFGISYSRIRWSRQVFQVRSETSRWSWCRSSRKCVKTRSGENSRFRSSNVLLHRRARVRAGSRRGSPARPRASTATRSRKAAADARASRPRSAELQKTTHAPRAADARRSGGAACRRSRSRCRRRARRARGPASGPRPILEEAHAGFTRRLRPLLPDLPGRVAARIDVLEELLLLEGVHARPEAVVARRRAACPAAASRWNGSWTSSSPSLSSRRSPGAARRTRR